MPWGWKSLQPGQTQRFCEENQRGEPKPSKKREVVQGTSSSPDQTLVLMSACSSSTGDALTKGREKHPAKGFLPSVSVRRRD